MVRQRAGKAAGAFDRVNRVHISADQDSPISGPEVSASENASSIAINDAGNGDISSDVDTASNSASDFASNPASPEESSSDSTRDDSEASGEASPVASRSAGKTASRKASRGAGKSASGSASGTARKPRRVGRPTGPVRTLISVRILDVNNQRLTTAVERSGRSPQYLVDAALSAYFDSLGIPPVSRSVPQSPGSDS